MSRSAKAQWPFTIPRQRPFPNLCDASAATAFQHYNDTTFEVLPAGPAGGAAPSTAPPVLTFPAIGTTGVSGAWTLDTQDMKPCGYVLRMVGVDRTNVDSRGNHFRTPISVGFCIEEPE